MRRLAGGLLFIQSYNLVSNIGKCRFASFSASLGTKVQGKHTQRIHVSDPRLELSDHSMTCV